MTLQCPDIHADLYNGSCPCLNLKQWHALLNALQNHSSAQMDVLLRASRNLCIVGRGFVHLQVTVILGWSLNTYEMQWLASG